MSTLTTSALLLLSMAPVSASYMSHMASRIMDSENEAMVSAGSSWSIGFELAAWQGENQANSEPRTNQARKAKRGVQPGTQRAARRDRGLTVAGIVRGCCMRVAR